MSQFDPQSFLDATILDANEKRPPLPTECPGEPNGLYTAVIGEIKEPKTGTIGKGERIGQPWISIPVPLRIQVPGEVQALGLPPELTITDGVFLDLTPQGAIDNGKGKNNRQRIYREATGTNTPGEPWNWRKLEGRLVKVKITHEEYNGATQERVGNIFPA